MSGRFQILVLGSGSALPTLNKNPSAQLLTVESGLYLIDCGEGTQLEMRRRSVAMQKVAAIFISHLHGDHYFGLVGLLSTMHLLGRKLDLHIYGPRGLQDIVAIQLNLSDEGLRFRVHFHVNDFQEPALIYHDRWVDTWAFPLQHRVPTHGFLFREKQRPRNLRTDKIAEYAIPVARIRAIKQGADLEMADGRRIPNAALTYPLPKPRSYAYCSDTVYLPQLSHWIKDVTLLYHEATFRDDLLDKAIETMHTTARQAASVAKEAGARQLLLGHFSARYKHVDGFLQDAREIFQQVILAEDGLKLEVDHMGS